MDPAQGNRSVNSQHRNITAVPQQRRGRRAGCFSQNRLQGFYTSHLLFTCLLFHAVGMWVSGEGVGVREEGLGGGRGGFDEHGAAQRN